MSTSSLVHPGAAAAADAHGDSTHEEPSHGTVRTYLTGFILAAILTSLAFGVVLTEGYGATLAAQVALGALAAARVIVHMVYFLRLNEWSEGGWTMMSLIFTIIIVVLVLIGSLWVMYHLETNTHAMPEP